MSYIGQEPGKGRSERFVYTASGSETSVSTSDSGAPISYTVGQLDVYLNGVKLINGTDFTATDGSSIGSLSALASNDVLEVVTQHTFSTVDNSNRFMNYNESSITQNIATVSGKNALSVGPITVGNGISVTVSSGTRWVVI